MSERSTSSDSEDTYSRSRSYSFVLLQLVLFSGLSLVEVATGFSTTIRARTIMPPRSTHSLAMASPPESSPLPPPSGLSRISVAEDSNTERLLHKLRSLGLPYQILPINNESSTTTTTTTSSNNNEAPGICKTLIWQATVLHDSATGSTSSFYLATLLPLHERLDRRRVQDSWNAWYAANDSSSSTSSSKKIHTLQLAPPPIAETLTGFASGTIPPIGHAVPIQLLVDTRLFLPTDDTTNGDQDSYCYYPLIRVGSGIPGYDLQIAPYDLLQFNPGAAKILPLTTNSPPAHNLEGYHGTKNTNGEGLISKSATAPNATIATTTTNTTNNNNINHNLLEEKKERKAQLSLLGETTTCTRNLTSSSQSLLQQEQEEQQIQRRKESWKGQPLAKRLRDVAGKDIFSIDDVRSCLEEAGTDLPQYLFGGPVQGNYTKTPLHNAAWRGTPDVLDLLVRTGAELGYPDWINMLAIGEGNFGKTPIVYAITRSRNDMVRHILETHPNVDVLLVNNKGQTPCSLAPSHLDEEVAQLLYAREAEQLQSGRSFRNFRESNSDHCKYGDLDPRFHIDESNMGEDLREDMKTYASSLASMPQINGMPYGDFRPRSLRPTTTIIRSALACERAGTAPRLKELLGSRNKEAIQRRHEMRQQKSKASKQDKEEPLIDVVSLEILDLPSMHMTVETVFVQDLATLQLLDREVDRTLQLAVLSQATESLDNEIATISWGLDSEWRPKSYTQTDNPVSVLQLSSDSTPFVIDLQSICQNGVTNPNITSMTAMESYLNEILLKLFRHPKISIIGFGLAQDLMKLAFSFPHLTCFGYYESIVDVQTVAKSLLSSIYSSKQISSLQNLVAAIMGKQLVKGEQCSDWEQRPLSDSQLRYAAIDSVCVRHVLGSMFQDVDYEYVFFERYSHLRQSIRLTVLSTEEKRPYKISMGSERTLMGVRLSKQLWQKGKEIPSAPRVITIEEEEERKVQRAKRKEAAAERRKSSRNRQRRKKSIQLKTLSGVLEELPEPGSRVGHSKDECVEAVLGGALINSIPQDYGLRFNRRGGIVELSNCFLLFINFSGNKKVNWKYQNRFEGNRINFSVNAQRGIKDTDLPFLYNSGCLDDQLDYIPETRVQRSILLFARLSPDSKFLFCGECACAGWESENDCYDVLLEVMHYDRLAAVEEFQEMLLPPE